MFDKVPIYGLLVDYYYCETNIRKVRRDIIGTMFDKVPIYGLLVDYYYCETNKGRIP